jgi:eukaryotic-like serine/threonine-protein kinase
VACLDENTIAAFLDARLGADDLAGVYQHLDGCVACAQLLFEAAGSPRKGDSRASTVDGESHPQAPAPGSAIGRYRVERIVGAGGMGVVYAAHDPQLERKVAIKLLRPSAAASSRRDRLIREAQAMARLSHRNVITVYEVGAVGEQLFVAMELVDGPSLAGWLKERPRSWREVLDVFLEAGRGLEAAHRAGLVHRDFKPDNVLVSRDGRVCVTDFGLARLAGESDSGESEPARDSPLLASLTRTGTLLGTPAYMAPEQLRGLPADARADVFSFCVSLYEGLFGARPFAGDTVEALARSIEAARIDPPASSETPGWVRQVVAAGLRADPSARPTSMRALLSALEHDPSARRRRRLWAGAALVGIAAAVAIPLRLSQRQAVAELCQGGAREIGAMWDAARLKAAFLATGDPSAASSWTAAERALDGYSRDWAAMHRSACEATRVRGEQSEDVLDLRMSCLTERRRAAGALAEVMATADRASLAPLVNAAQSLPALADCADLPSLRARLRPPSDPKVRARVEELMGEAERLSLLRNLRRYGEARPAADKLLVEARAVDYPPLLSRALYWSSSVHFDNGDVPTSVVEMREAAAAALRGGDDVEAAMAWDALVEFDKPLRRAWSDLADAALGRAHTTTADHLWTRADLAMEDHHWEQAFQLYEKAYATFRKLDSYMGEVQMLAFGAAALQALGRAEEARARCLAAVDMARSHELASFVVYPLDCLAEIETAAGHYREAIENYRQMIVVFESSGQGRSWTDPVRVRMAFNQIEIGQAEEALKVLREADRGDDEGERLYGQGLALLKLGRSAEARAVLERAVKREGNWLDGAKFALAKALWPRDQARVLALAKEARERFVGDARDRRLLAEADEWLRARN